MQVMLPLAANSGGIETNIQDNEFKYNSTMRRISALGWSTDLRQLSEMHFVQLYDYAMVSTHKYQHLVLKGTKYKKLKSYQFLFEGNVKKLECKAHENKMYVRVNVLPSTKKTPYRVVMECAHTCDVLRAAGMCPAGLGLQGKGNANHIRGVLFAIKDLSWRGLKQNPEPLTCTFRFTAWLIPHNQSVAV